MRHLFARLLARWRSDAAPRTSGAARAQGMQQGMQSMPGGMPMLDCESVMRQLWDFLDGELTPERMAAVRAHIEMCKRCYPQHEFEQSFLDAVAARRRQHSDPQRLRRRVADALRAKGLSDA